MNNPTSEEKVSSSKKIITIILVVGVLVVAAFFVNSAQSRTSNEAQVGRFFSRIAESISNLFQGGRRFPTFANQGFAAGNSFFESGNSLDGIINLSDFATTQANALSVNSFGESFIPELDTLEIENSFIVEFETAPVALKTVELLKKKNITLQPTLDKNILKSAVANSKIEIESHKQKIQNEQNVLLSKIEEVYGAPKSTRGSTKVYGGEQSDIVTHSLKSATNAITISGVSEDELAQFVKNVPNIKNIEPARLVKASLTNTAEVISANQLAQFIGPNGTPLTGEGTVVAIVDTGVDYMHQDLGACNFLIEGGCKVAYGYDFINEDPDPMDDHGHGTHVAATAAGNGFYTDGDGQIIPLQGIAPDATIYAYKVLSAAGSGSSLSVIRGIEACVDPNGDGDISDKVTVCSLSLGANGGNPMDSQSLAADAAVDAGVIMTIAAGNDGPSAETIGSPGTSRKAITVGAACKPEQIGSNPRCDDAVASFSSRGPVVFTNELGQTETLQKPDIVAPGVNICAAQWGSYQEGNTCLGDGEHIAISGTSMATPVVAGLMALLAQAHPEKTVAELKDALMITSDDLGLSVTTQGQGMVNGLATLEGVGIPNSMLRIEGIPFIINDTSPETIATYSKELTITNIREYPVNLSVSRLEETPGVFIDFPTNISLEAGEETSFLVTVTIDRSLAQSALNAREELVFSDGLDEVSVVITRRTPSYIVLENAVTNFGLFHYSDTDFEVTKTITLTNRLTEQPVTYSISIDESLISDSAQDNIAFTSSLNEITLGPGETRTFDVTLTASSTQGNVLPNGTYKGLLQLGSSLETVNIELKFFRGWAFTFNFPSKNPDVVVLRGSSWQVSYKPNPQLPYMTLFATQPGPYKAMAVYREEDGSFDKLTGIFSLDISLLESGDIVEYDVDKNLSEHTITNTYAGNSCIMGWYQEEGNYRFDFMGGGKLKFSYNSIPEDVDFSLMCGQLKSNAKKMILSQIYLTQGLNQDFTLDDSSSDKSTRYVYAADNRYGDDEVSLGINLCNIRIFKYDGFIDSDFNFCTYWQSDGGKSITLSNGDVAVVEVNSLHTDTPESTIHPTYPSFRIHAFDKDQENLYLYTSAEMFATSEKLYAWSPMASGITSTSTSSHDIYEKHKIDIVNDNFITVGIGPVIDVSTVKAYRNDYAGVLNAYHHGFQNWYRYSDGSTETNMLPNLNPIESSVSFTVNDSWLADTLVDMESFFNKDTYLPDVLGQFSKNTPPGLGNYEITTQRNGLLYGEEENLGVTKYMSFNLQDDASIDPVPPQIENIQIVANGLLQNVFDSDVQNSLRLFVNPGYGFAYHNLVSNIYGAYDIEYLEDTLQMIQIFVGGTQDTLQLVSEYTEFDEYLNFAIPQIETPGDFVYFKVSAVDASNNTTDYDFKIPTGTALVPEEIANPSLLNCVLNQPSVVLSPGDIQLVAGGPVVPFEVSITNHNTLACDPVEEYELQINTAIDFIDVYQPNKIRVTLNPNDALNGNFITTSVRLEFFDLLSEDTQTKTIWFRADAGVYDYTYSIDTDFTSSDGQINNLDLGWSADVESQVPHPVNCGRNQPTITPVGNLGSFGNNENLSRSFGLQITNNDNENCPSTTFTVMFSDNLDNFGTSKTSMVNQNSSFVHSFLSLAPGATATKNVFYKAFNVSDEQISFTATATDTTQLGSYHDPEVYEYSVIYGNPVIEEPIPPHCNADFNKDGQVSTADQLLFNTAYGTVNATYDLDGSGGPVNASDLVTFLSFYGQGGCPVENEVPVEDQYTNIANDPEITIEYQIESEKVGNTTVYEYEVILTNTGVVTKNNLVAYNVIPDAQLSYAEFVGATAPDLQVDLDTGALYIPSMDGGETISVFITVTIPD